MGFAAGLGTKSSRPGQLAYEGSDGIMGHQGNLMFTVAHGGITFAAIDRAFALHEQMMKSYPRGYVHFMVTRVGAPIPTGAARERLNELAQRYSHHILASAVVIEGNALWTSAVRIALSAMSLARKKAQPRQFFVTSAEALAWLEERAGNERRFRTAEVLRAIAHASHEDARIAV